MLKLENHLQINKKTMLSPNLAGEFTSDDLKKIGVWVWEGFDRDLGSRFKWEKRMQAAMDLALQVQKAKTFPWPGASNVAFPLITIATLQFHSRAYPALVSGPEIVKCRVLGEDPQGEAKAKALRIGCHMSYQVLEEDESWEEQHDRLLINLPIVGCAFKKTYHDGEAGTNRSELVLAKDFVLDYYAKSVEGAARKTHILPLYRNEMLESMITGKFSDYSDEPWFQGDARPLQDDDTGREDARTGANTPDTDESTPFTTLEQHCWADLDGDGFSEPYIITIESSTKTVLRIVARWDRESDVLRARDGRVYRINATEYFTKYTFIPSPDGSIYDLGFGILLGPLNESTNSLLNQLIDAGTMANTAGGFLARGAKIRGGAYTFAPLEWKRVDSTGDDLKKSVMPLPVREPSAVLFQLLSLLINYTERISGSTDIMSGVNIGQNTPKGTADQLVEQGSKIYGAIFKRCWRSMKYEFQKLFCLNAVYLPQISAYGPAGAKALREDYTSDMSQIVPAADPNVVSDQARIQQAITIKQSSATTPGYDIEQVEHNFLRALKVEGIETLYPGPKKMPPSMNPKVQIEQLRLQAKQMQLAQQQKEFLISMMEEQRLNTAKILELEAKASLESANASGVAAGHKIAAFEAAVGALKAHDDALRSRIEIMMNAMEKQDESSSPDGGRIPGLVDATSNEGILSGALGMGAG